MTDANTLLSSVRTDMTSKAEVACERLLLWVTLARTSRAEHQRRCGVQQASHDG